MVKVSEAKPSSRIARDQKALLIMGVLPQTNLGFFNRKASSLAIRLTKINTLQKNGAQKRRRVALRIFVKIAVSEDIDERYYLEGEISDSFINVFHDFILKEEFRLQ